MTFLQWTVVMSVNMKQMYKMIAVSLDCGLKNLKYNHMQLFKASKVTNKYPLTMN